MEVNWYPGHMARAERELKEAAAHIDVLVEMVDARVPRCSSNPRLKSIVKNRPVIMLFNKADLADPAINTQWQFFFASSGYPGTFINAEKGEGIGKARELVLKAASARMAGNP